MTKKKIILIVIAVIILLVLILVLLSRQTEKSVVGSGKGTGDIPVPTTIEAEMPPEAANEASDEETTDYEIIKPIDENVFLTDAMPDFDSLFDSPAECPADIVTVEFDGLNIRPGMKVSEIIDSSDWYTLRETDVLQPDGAGYLILNNDQWTNGDIQLNDDSNARNGEIILWVHNYSDSSVVMRDCTIYKYKINYLGCSEVYTEQPEFSYLDKYALGYQGSYDGCDNTERVADGSEVYIRHTFGNINECQVILDSNDDEGLFAITVSCNEFYGPDFGIKDGDKIG